LINAHPDDWRELTAGLDVEDTWGPKWAEIRLWNRQLMAKAAPIVACGFSLTEAVRRLVPPEDLVEHYHSIQTSIRLHPGLWQELVARHRRKFAIPEGQFQRAILVDTRGRRVGRYRGNRRGGKLAVARPNWNLGTGDLRFGIHLARHVDKKRGKNVARLLDAFEEMGWPKSIDDPLPGPPRGAKGVDPPERLQEAVKRLNDGLSHLRFRTQGGTKIIWERVA
jgi:hypothetical protein